MSGTLRRSVVGVIALTFVVTVARPAHAAAIQFQVRDLADLVSGEDLWEYDYSVIGQTFLQDDGFSVLFDPALYSDLIAAPAPDAAWDILTLQPDPALPDAGIYDALALVGGASVAQPFAVSFLWLGAPGSAPGSQPFTINRFDSSGSLTILETGRTSPHEDSSSVPEPSTLTLMAAGAISVASRIRRRRTSS